MAKRVILSLCDFTGIWSRPYEDAGYQVIRVDLRDGRDVRLLEYPVEKAHGILAAPPCTVFSKAGAWKWKEWGTDGLLAGLSIVDACLRAVMVHRPGWWVLENPAGRLRRYLGEPAFSFQPHEYGDPWTKRTFLWGSFVPPLPLFSEQARHPTAPIRDRSGRDRTSQLTSTDFRRSATPEGFARAFFESNP